MESHNKESAVIFVLDANAPTKQQLRIAVKIKSLIVLQSVRFMWVVFIHKFEKAKIGIRIVNTVKYYKP
jgi:hypothetical protein